MALLTSTRRQIVVVTMRKLQHTKVLGRLRLRRRLFLRQHVLQGRSWMRTRCELKSQYLLMIQLLMGLLTSTRLR